MDTLLCNVATIFINYFYVPKFKHLGCIYLFASFTKAENKSGSDFITLSDKSKLIIAYFFKIIFKFIVSDIWINFQNSITNILVLD